MAPTPTPACVRVEESRTVRTVWKYERYWYSEPSSIISCARVSSGALMSTSSCVMHSSGLSFMRSICICWTSSFLWARFFCRLANRIASSFSRSNWSLAFIVSLKRSFSSFCKSAWCSFRLSWSCSWSRISCFSRSFLSSFACSLAASTASSASWCLRKRSSSIALRICTSSCRLPPAATARATAFRVRSAFTSSRALSCESSSSWYSFCRRMSSCRVCSFSSAFNLIC
mmetsp:Transcript_29421/g.49433  ORF Transcript_29421/g.49433 Transcript_29421/m.49433 type:complete len:229 (+) Transcript_29421:290-976(+)